MRCRASARDDGATLEIKAERSGELGFCGIRGIERRTFSFRYLSIGRFKRSFIRLSFYC